MPVLPSSTVPSEPRLAVRQNDASSSSFTAVPSTYGAADNSPHPGVVAGIVLGSVAGFLLLLYLIYMLLHGGPVIVREETSGAPMSSVTGDSSTHASRSVMSFRRDRRQQRKPRSTGSRRTRSRATTVRSRDRSRRRVSPVIVDPAPPRVVPGSGVSTVSSDNEIIVEEEHTPPPRRSYGQRQSQDRYRREPLVRDDGYGPPRDHSPRRDSRRYSRDR
ncbi:hypothetical protein FZEAL_3948 [Fusarium zealandicum]|uniref:Uncharacterized protein n=1 Tax=Fusarium zealandicum TaxID=1053134 RepID=A0A8H4UN99_9HYPO|nr:hypothetical protein FZEAL_3948 [Fusarium zealandicum]